MHDPHLYDLLHGETKARESKTDSSTQKKNKFDLAIENYIDQYIDSLNFEREIHDNPLTTPQAKKTQIRNELNYSLQMPDLENFLNEAFKELFTHHHNYLPPELCRKMEQEFLRIDEKMDKIDVNEVSEKNFQTLFKISHAVMDGILTVGIAKYQEEEYASCLAIFTLLTSLNPGNEDYWYRLGIAAQKCEDYPLALKAYENTLEISPDLLGAHVFSAECHFHLNQKESAQQSFIKAKEIAETQEIEEVWKVLMSKLGEVL